MWKAVIPKFCNYSVKAPFPYHQTFGSGILARGWGQAAGPDLLFSNSNGDSSGLLLACGWLTPRVGLWGFPFSRNFSACLLPKRTWLRKRKRVGEKAMKRGPGEDCFEEAIIWGPQILRLVGRRFAFECSSE